MKTKIISIIISLSCFSVYGQTSVESILAEIETNNTGIIALRKKVEADQLGNRTGIFPSDPEIGIGYLYGSPSDIGNRTDISIMQSFDFPTVYAYRNRIAGARNLQAELEYTDHVRKILHEARLLCIDIIHANALIREYDKRLTDARDLAFSFKTKLDSGEGNILDYNKAQLNMLNIKNESERIIISRNSLLSQLATLNGGMPVNFDEADFPVVALPGDFENWYLAAEQNNPALSWLKREIEVIDLQKKLSVAEQLPRLSAGYMSEKVVGQQYRGISAGLSVPLWEKRNSVRYANAQAVAVSSMEADRRLIFYNQLKTEYEKVADLQKSVTAYRLSLESFDNTALLRKALDRGEISLSDYVLGITIYYESVDRLLDAERELNEAVAGLLQYSGDISAST